LLLEIRTQGQNDDEWVKICTNVTQSVADVKDFLLKDNVLYYKGKLFIPNSIDLKKMIIEQEHDSIVVGHMRAGKTVELVRRNFYWPQMDT
jgi:hypothetical protein